MVEMPATSTKKAPKSVAKPTVEIAAAPVVAEPSTKDGIADVIVFLTELLKQSRDAEVLELVQQLLLKMLGHQQDLDEQLAALRKHIFGRRSEQVSAAQLALFLQQAFEVGEAPQPAPPPVEPETKPEPAKPAYNRPGRNKLPAHLPRNRIELKVAPELRICEICGQEKACIGHETSEVLNFVPGHFEVLEYAREKLACKPCQEGICTAAPGEKLQGGGMCGPGLVAQILVAKYLDHCPLFRQHVIFLRSGVNLAQSSIGTCVTLGYSLLLPVAMRLWALTCKCAVVGGDDTPMKVLDSDHEKGIKTGHIWAYLGYDENGKPAYASMGYTKNWEAKGPAEFLKEFTGTLQGDGYKGWKSISKKALAILIAGCWAHARRKIVEAVDAKQLAAAVALALIRKLYAIEAFAREHELSVEQRKKIRQEQAKPVMVDLRKWIDEQLPKVRPTSAIGKAVTYLNNQWKHLQVYLDDGRVPIDNNLVENQIRPVCLGKKNYLFAGSDAGGERMAVIYTVFATCKIVGAEPWPYLNDVLPQLARLPQDADVDHLLPGAWVARRAAALVPACEFDVN